MLIEVRRTAVKLIVPELKIGAKVEVLDGERIRGKILSLKSKSMGDEYVVIKLEKPNKSGRTTIEVLKSEFNYHKFDQKIKVNG